MMKLFVSTETRTLGSTAAKSSTIWVLEPLLKAKSFVSTVVSHQTSNLLTRSAYSKDVWKFHMRAPSAI